MDINYLPQNTQVAVVDDDEDLFRRLMVASWAIPNQDGSFRPSSAVYRSKSDDISVDIASKTTPEKSIKDAFALIGILAKEPKNLGYHVLEKPLEENPAHAIIEGKITKSHAKKLATASIWVIEPRR